MALKAFHGSLKRFLYFFERCPGLSRILLTFHGFCVFVVKLCMNILYLRGSFSPYRIRQILGVPEEVPRSPEDISLV